MTSQEMLEKMMSRQGSFEWGDEYIPCILATTREAPKISRATRLNSRKLQRTLHLLSTPERVYAELALYHPNLFDLHEQKMLFPAPKVHPLHGHPLAIGMDLPPLEGTLDVAERIGFKHHEIIAENDDGERSRVPYIYVGDLLLYLIDTAGKPYAVNWTVKKCAEDFSERRRTKVKTPAQQRVDQEHERLRHLLEEVYYQDAGIRTVRVSEDKIDSNVRANLDFLYGRHNLKLDIDPAVLNDFSCEVEEAVRIGDPVALVAIRYGARWGARDKFLSKIYKDIWERKLLIDLFRPILIDHPLEMQSRDVLDVYGHLFNENPT
ncbi:hypothetical protein ACFPU0_02940 [Pseudomonas sp. GCM10022186]|uniref:hypothetical protein n=1 Tax=Pseudomonadaceae TaxID=135621 RepID=UPI00237F3EDC|nr:hypothetical protein [Pseudomonas resinovorans]MDE3739390.1 hypothetical protein [Pseudomonas resinovorans]